AFGLLDLFSVNIEDGVVVDPLAAKADPLIKPRLRAAIIVSHVPLAEKPGSISDFLQVFRKEYKPVRLGRVVIHNGMRMRVLARQNRRAAWRTQGRADERIFKMGTFLGHAVHAGGLKSRNLVHKSHKIKSVVVAQDKHHVSWLFHRLGSRYRDARHYKHNHKNRT